MKLLRFFSNALGHLALAIAVAGAATREGFCQFHEYLDYHEQERRQRYRQRLGRSAAQQRSHSEDARYESKSSNAMPLL